ncbi:phosphonate C-P lyase system protein PhnH [uncultured Roseibium sp.]|uniref:phosphonate C-P lyase system protein PhnH n=1 Tax=uncultured Roseibium sp. TaxID=1936171 RepID=UPI002624103A|nr:phosphonate C-P lyase system protein PhnH [uncultured Roseibium sp.]
MDTAIDASEHTTALAAGFQDPVHNAQECFRAIMNAMARPGTEQLIREDGLVPPAPLTPTVAAIVLTLLDYDTPVWLDRPLMTSDAVKSFLRFHTGAPIVKEPVEAAFAIVADPAHLVPLASFNQGSAEYPDRSTTVVLSSQEFGKHAPVTLEGPGIKDRAALSTGPLPPVFWDQVSANSRLFPRGVDLIFSGKGRISALPRSTRILPSEV